MNKELQKIARIERQLSEVRSQLNELCGNACQTISNDVEAAVMPGVKPASGNVSIASISFSSIANSGGFIWSPEYYIPKSQARLVSSALTAAIKKNGATGLRETLSDMVERHSVILKKTRYPLNPYTISVLKNALAELCF